MSLNLDAMMTERRNPASAAIDTLSTLDILTLINAEDSKVAPAIARILPQIAQAVDAVSAAFARQGRLIYCGAGTSGRLGILDASECPPTFGTPAEQVIGVIAGGQRAILQAVENAEDNPQAAQDDLQRLALSSRDVVVGIAASGRTPYVLGALRYARDVGATTVALSCNPDSPMSPLADILLTPIVGPEVITGSSRMKAGTAQKMILNMLSSAAMIRSGKVYGNLMVDVEATNAKLVERQIRIVMEAGECDRATAVAALEHSQRQCKTAIVMVLTGLSAAEAQALLDRHRGFIRPALNERSA
ncbi:N-acetylmuramic acid 6-phosphate etherase [Edwardsiella piscicida]|nr:N-acetylmuramic acid 6-phosphate etherase [Edwardsiella piscicida]ARD20046.1 N-acetylmuramic acid 6-phosphate etherase [Edwardsiella piscicida]MDM3863951.1 N-acetylmuramic acid 6-phosphate etherase [Edwardsiella piscicida]QBB14356.1 N-acetylmuramic acid 6-phosphate etherase [Edwardsiella piscicida]UCQ16280.1 N-acetylmuramic acid 6-phosphate etherase [Edwardsiella piscicida]UCQ39491.1 N-acetylmuramic acid 6-phosphate etherase [Edwardsiella piscicida]